MVETNNVMVGFREPFPRPPVRILVQSRPPTPLSKLVMPDTSELALHSPSDQIVGTPFAVDSPRFEYPFPKSTTNSTDSIPSLQGAGSSSSTFSSSSSSSLTVLSPGPTPLDSRSYSPTHPKMCIADPPVPPGLIKKHRWSMGLLGRKTSSGHKDLEGKGRPRNHSSKLLSESRRRYSVGTPPEMYNTPLEGPDDVEGADPAPNPYFATSALNRTTSNQT
ncbi:hypothetical protein PQX77_012852 [Marasmius sp. AFHP31]|nr:hypothetical protein PQX77_012852 [Marasmius sp. AFHP31]